jgi:hypothetical protein
MEVKTSTSSINTVEVTKTYSDFSAAALTNSISLFNLPANAAAINIGVSINTGFANVDSYSMLSLPDSLIGARNVTNFITPYYKRSLLESPYMKSDSVATDIQATLVSTGIGTWSAGGDLNTARWYGGGAGTQIAGLFATGTPITGGGSEVTNNEEYDGTVWANANAVLLSTYIIGCFGIQTAAVICGGYSPICATTQEYDGTSWTYSNDISANNASMGSFGTQTAGLICGGVGLLTTTEEYDGTSWTSANDLNTGKQGLAGCGTQTAGLSFGGFDGSYSAVTEEYDGTSWTAANAMNTARQGLSGAGTQTSGLSFGGTTGSDSTITEEYDGTSWTSSNGLNTARQGLSGAGTQTSGLSFGGATNLVTVVTTEEYTKTTPQNLNQLSAGSITFKMKYIQYGS